MNKLVSISVLATLVVSTPAMANKVKKFNLRAPEGFTYAPVIKVYSTNGEKWNKVDKTKITTFKAEFNAECRFEGKGNKAYRGDLQVKGFTQVGDEDPIDILIPHASETRAQFRYDGNTGLDVVNVCNTELAKRLSQDADKTKYHILSKGFTVKYPAAFRLDYHLRCQATGLGKTDLDFKHVLVNAKINCMGSDLAKAKIPKPKPKPPKRKSPERAKPLIEKIQFAPNQKHIVGKCPAQVEFNGQITASRAGIVEYQYVSHDKRTSPKFTLKFDKAGSKAVRVWKRTINKEETKAKLAFDTGKKKPYDYHGWYRLEVLSPKGFKSRSVDYSLQCVEKGSRKSQ